ncbi:major facilitator superfamily transporter [Ameyamaea chiangmaiensis NBRC 103196]|uniref:MFS transporter n=1 Tax=Ameyamaea chiangmaiensis TaxID=442969 RepID=A0A850PDP4_9PROT|nr:MFS transporter [Ameyamaea chiangmaiensis]MBS4075735.1 MFS transporter [Ameyamaea chiangmaiensis]NVN40809.1 MFS transporter [Ameyamaea chiangmaiensis]GBQ70344.1 major facilitator superfamily transporter [Ameyamaea chiangmaiensis NBRC 103196]
MRAPQAIPHVPATTPPVRPPWRPLLALLFPINLLLALDRNVMVMAAPLIQHEFHLHLAQMAVVFSAMAWTYAAGQLPAGLLTERFGARVMLGLAVAGWSLSTLLMPLAGGFAGLVLLRLLLGLGQAPDWSASLVTVQHWFAPASRSRATAVLLGAMYVAPVVGSPLTGWLLQTWPWQGCFALYGVVGVLMAALWMWGTRTRLPHTRPTHVTPGASLRRVLEQPRLWIAGALYFAVVSVQSFFMSWLPTYLMQVHGLSLRSSGVLTALPWLSLYVSVTVAGQVTDRVLRHTGSIWWARVPLGLLGLLSGGIALLAIGRLQGMPSIIALLCLSLAGVGAAQVCVWGCVQDLGDAMAATVTGWVALWGNAASGIIPIIMALLVEHGHGWDTALRLPFVVAMAGAGCLLALRPHHPLTLRRENRHV